MNVTVAGLIVAVIACVVAILLLLVNYRSLRLQQRQPDGHPGKKVDAGKAAAVLSNIQEDPVRAIAADHIFVESEKKPVGYIDRLPIGVYLDLHSASCDPKKRQVLAASLSEFIRLAVQLAQGSGVSIASPHEGNLLLGAAVAQTLSANFLVVRTGRAPRFGFPIEGSFVPGSAAVLVDDLCMEGKFLGRCVTLMRRYGLNVSDCVCLFERLDGDTRQALSAMSVNLHSRYQIDDSELRNLKAFGKTALELATVQSH